MEDSNGIRTVIENALADAMLQGQNGQATVSVSSGGRTYVVHVWNIQRPFVPHFFSEDHFGLTPRQAEVARLLCLRRTNAEISHSLNVTIHTACRHVEAVLLKVGAGSRYAVGDILSAAYTQSCSNPS